jgi:diadenosine tetraphosphatase ApaH/serine/threonine PP2A family protein phosphatase
LRSCPHLCIAGNHDWATLGKLDLRDFNPDAREANLWNRQQLTPENLAYLDALPETLVKGQFTLVHGSPRYPIWEYIIYPSTAEDNLEHLDTPFCLVGHTHTPVIFRARDEEGANRCEMITPVVGEPVELGSGPLIANPGSVGQPRDGDARASYVILDSQALTIEHRRVAYPVETTQAKMMEHNIPLRLVLRLGYGW